MLSILVHCLCVFPCFLTFSFFDVEWPDEKVSLRSLIDNLARLPCPVVGARLWTKSQVNQHLCRVVGSTGMLNVAKEAVFKQVKLLLW